MTGVQSDVFHKNETRLISFSFRIYVACQFNQNVTVSHGGGETMAH